MLAQYLRHLGLMEQRGSGISRMKRLMLEHGLDAPGYEYRDGYFCVILKGPGKNLDRVIVDRNVTAPASKEALLTERQRRIAKWLAKGDSVTNRNCQKHFRISKVTAMNDLGALVNVGIAERVGRGRSVRYLYKGEKR